MNKITDITFTGDWKDRDYVKAIIKQAGKNGLELIINDVRKMGIESYEGHVNYLREVILKYKSALRESTTVKELISIRADITEAIACLHEILYATADPMPDAGVFITDALAREANGKEYWINDGMNERTKKRFANAIKDLELKKDAIEGKIEALSITEKKQSGCQQPEYSTLREIFINPDHYDPCLKVLQDITPSAINPQKEYVGNSKGVFPLWIRELETRNFIHTQCSNIAYKNLLNKEIKNLNLSKDASEFTKRYKRLETSDISDDIKYSLSQIEQ